MPAGFVRYTGSVGRYPHLFHHAVAESKPTNEHGGVSRSVDPVRFWSHPAGGVASRRAVTFRKPRRGGRDSADPPSPGN